MKHVLLLLAVCAAANAVTIDSLLGTQTLATVQLDAGAAVQVCDINTPTFCDQYLMPGMANGDSAIVWFGYGNYVNVGLRNGTPTVCHGNPCQLTGYLASGRLYFGAEETNGGVSLNPRRILGGSFAPLVNAPVASPTFPREVLGQDGYVDSFNSTVPAGAPTTSCSEYVRVNNHGYQIASAGATTGSSIFGPWDGKFSIAVGSSGWINLNNSNSTSIDENAWRSFDGVHAIGSSVPTIETLTAIPDGSFAANSTTTFQNRFNQTDGVTSGGRFLAQYVVCGAPVTLTQISVASNVATATVSGGLPAWLTSGADVLIVRAPGIYARFNGGRHVTGTGAGTFTFTPCGGTNGTSGHYTIACTSPDGTYTVPTSTANASLLAAYPATAQPTMVAYQIVTPTLASISYDDPSTYTAPAGGNAANGLTDFTTRSSLLVPNGGDSYTITAACSDCHAGNATLTGGMANPGSDLAYFNYSNYAIEVRTQFHNLTHQQQLDIAAYIRSLPTGAGGIVTTSDACRPFNPVMQPMIGLMSTPALVDCGGGIDSLLTYDNDWKEYAAPGGSYSTWAYNQTFNHHEIPSQFQLFPWDAWLPAVHPADAYPSVGFFTHLPYSNANGQCTGNNNGCYLPIVSAVAANTTGSYTTEATAISNMNTTLNTFLQSMSPRECVDALVVQGSCVAPSYGNVRLESVRKWEMVKDFELMHPNLEQHFDTFYTAIKGARGAGSYETFGWGPFYGRGAFDSGPHIVSDGIPAWNTTGGNALGYPHIISKGFSGTSSLPFATETNAWYITCPIMNFGNYTQKHNDCTDESYLPNFLAQMGVMRPCFWECIFRYVIEMNQASADLTPNSTTNGMQASVWGTGVTFAMCNANAPNAAFMSASDLTSVVDEWVQLATTQLNLFTPTQWKTDSVYFPNPDTSNSFSAWFCGGIVQSAPVRASLLALNDLGKWFGVSSTDLSNLATAIAALGITNTYPVDDTYVNGGLNRKSGQTSAAWWPYFSNMGSYLWSSVTTLTTSGGITSGATSATFADCTNVPNLSTVLIDSEQIGVTSGGGSPGSCNVTIRRGMEGTTAASHAQTATVSN